MKVLFVTYQFLPIADSNVTWMVNVFELLQKEKDIEIEVYTWTRNRFRRTETMGGVKVTRLWRVSDYFLQFKDYIDNIILSHERFKFFFLKAFDSIFNPLYKLLAKKSCYGEASFANNICYYTDVSKYDIVVSCVCPGQNAAAACRIKSANPSIKWISIYFDIYSSLPTYDDETKRVLGDQELLWTKIADANIYAKDLESYMRQTEFWNDRSIALPIPAFSLKDLSVHTTVNSVEAINVVYTGQFYENIRRPEFLLDLFSELCGRDKRIKLHIAGWGMEKVLSSYKDKMGSNLVLHGRLGLGEVDELLDKADILVNVGNSVPYFLPSKLLSYLRTCKPIIHISSIQEDASLGYIYRYPIHLCLNEHEITEELITTTLEYIIENHSRRCSLDDIRMIYANDSAEFFTEKLISIFRSLY